jgi:hypothetical protein
MRWYHLTSNLASGKGRHNSETTIMLRCVRSGVGVEPNERALWGQFHGTVTPIATQRLDWVTFPKRVAFLYIV